jgi:hypothetical protein
LPVEAELFSQSEVSDGDWLKAGTAGDLGKRRRPAFRGTRAVVFELFGTSEGRVAAEADLSAAETAAPSAEPTTALAAEPAATEPTTALASESAAALTAAALAAAALAAAALAAESATTLSTESAATLAAKPAAALAAEPAAALATTEPALTTALLTGAADTQRRRKRGNVPDANTAIAQLPEVRGPDARVHEPAHSTALAALTTTLAATLAAAKTTTLTTLPAAEAATLPALPAAESATALAAESATALAAAESAATLAAAEAALTTTLAAAEAALTTTLAALLALLALAALAEDAQARRNDQVIRPQRTVQRRARQKAAPSELPAGPEALSLCRVGERREYAEHAKRGDAVHQGTRDGTGHGNPREGRRCGRGRCATTTWFGGDCERGLGGIRH